MSKRSLITGIIVLIFFLVLNSSVFSQSVNDKNYWKTEGEKYQKNKDYYNAAESYKKALSFDEQDVDILYHVSFNLNELQKYDEAIEYCNKAISIIDRDTSVSIILVGDIYCEKGYALIYTYKYQDALNYFDMAIKTDSNWSYPWYLKALTYYEMRNKNNGLQCINKCLEIEPDYPEAIELKNDLLKL